ncbi:MAG TPA: UDP-N-acetylmuramoyl-tripeptide--D-alanyl-D-alanine ligase, partial [Gammaproteobacteria bacterium]|nr:UDP-N-acetylmuramoyl-tripeptide--D-alanyl-D-alanine ligase [Gammaproteobacteria bacterium]
MFRLDDVAKMLGGTLTGGDAEITSVSTDTRTLKPGALFVALDGERFEGSDFLADADRLGAAAVLTRHPGSNALPSLIVEDTTAALGQLAAHWRARFDIPVIGVTGSNGKTTVKEMIGAIFAEAGAVHISPGNFNNHIGVPLALLGLREHHRFAVIEMGMNHPGEIDYLSRLGSPTTALITNAALAHLEGLGSLAGVVRAKAEIFHGLRPGGTAVI